ncbi:MAG: hypothetical protein ACKO3P_10370 [Planctomycetaceae bacterium]
MSQAVLVRGSFRRWDLILVILAGALASLVGLVFMRGAPIPGIPIAGAVCALGGAVALWRRKRQRQRVRVQPDGFTLLDSNGETEFEDLQVESLALDLQRNEAGGLVQSITRILTLWLDETTSNDRSQRLEFRTTLQPGEVDPLSELIARLHTQVLELARDQLSDGRAFSGTGWRLEEGDLVFSSGATPLECPLEDIAVVGVVDRELRIWRTGRDEAWAGVKLNGRNAYVLKELLAEQLEHRDENGNSLSDSDQDSDSLGRIIFERTGLRSSRVILSLLTFLFPLVGVLLILAGQNNRRADGGVMQFWGGVLLLATLPCVLGLIYSWRYLFRCHERGLLSQGLLKKRQLRYDHIEAFSFQATRQFINGGYAGTIFVLDFEPDAEHSSQRIKYSVQLKTSDDELERLRDHVANFLAERMFHQIAAGERVPWTPALVFESGNLLYTPSGLLGRKSTVSIPLAQIDRFQMNNGQCELFRQGDSKVAVSESVASRNFFPGFFCLLQLIRRQQEQPLPIQDFEPR